MAEFNADDVTMTGPEHYRYAEDLAHDARLILERQTPDTAEEAKAGAIALTSLAQVHATLALTAAMTAQRWVGPESYENGGRDVNMVDSAWNEVTR